MKIEDRVRLETDPLTGGAVLALAIPEHGKVVRVGFCNPGDSSAEVSLKLRGMAELIAAVVDSEDGGISVTTLLRCAR